MNLRPRLRGQGQAAADEPAAAPATARSLRVKAIAWLARREHSRAEIGRKLARFCGDAELIDAVLRQLEDEKLLSDVRFAESVVRVRGARYGSARVADDLRGKGVAGEDAAVLIAGLRAGDLERARAVWERKFGAPAADAAARAKQMRFLQARGFPAEVIRRVVPRCGEPVDDE